MKTVTLALALAGALMVHQVASAQFAPAVISDNFSTNPLQNGWQVFGNTNLFQWNPTNQNVDVTWDSSQPDSFFYHTLGTTLTKADNFTISFDLQITNAQAGGYGFELALGLLNIAEATNNSFNRSTGANSPDLVELDYFPDVGYGPTVWPAFVDSSSTFSFNGASDYAIYAPTPGDWYHVVMTYTAADQTMVTTMTNYEQTSGITISDTIATNLTDFNVDTFSISSYQDDGYGDSIYAQGVVDNVSVTIPPLPIKNLTEGFQDGRWRAQFTSLPGWTYTLQSTVDFQSWRNVSVSLPGNGATLHLLDTNAPGKQGFYRVHATQP
jgi:hypothetical protein